MIKLVAFDWNGTLFADTDAIVESVNKVLKLLNFFLSLILLIFVLVFNCRAYNKFYEWKFGICQPGGYVSTCEQW